MAKLFTNFADEYPLIYELFTKRLKLTLAAAALLFAAVAAVNFVDLIWTSEDLFTKYGPIIGGDFIVFNFAAKIVGTPDMIAIYEMANLKAALQAAYPDKGDFNLGWMYPPTMYLLIKPFGDAPYLASYALWVATFGGFFFTVIWRFWPDKWAFFFVLTAPATFQAIITGQNGFLTASLIALIGAFADRRPIIAGIAAGLLTIKPQLGILIPVAFIAAGCWRAFFITAVSAILFALLSLIAFGPEPWSGFFESVAAHSARMGEMGFPDYKLVTPYGFFSTIGAPDTSLIPR